MNRPALVVAISTLLMTTAHAANAQEPSAADKETARALLNEGDAHFTKGAFPKALEAYRQADRLMHVPTTGLEVAKAEAAVGLLVEAKATCLGVVNHPVATPEPPAFASARRKCTEMSNALSTRIPSVTFHLVGVFADAAQPTPTVNLDGAEIPSETRRRLNPGNHTVTINAPGYEAFSKTFDLHEGETADVPISLRAKTMDPAPVPAAATQPMPAAPRLVRAPIPTYAWVAMGVGGAALAVGGVTGAMSLGKLDDVKAQCRGDVCPPAARSDLDSTRTFETVANVSFGLALVGAVVATYGILSRGHVEERVAWSAR